MLAVGVDRRLVELTERLQVAEGQVLHGQVDAPELPARRRQVTAQGRPTRQDDGVVLAAQLLDGEVAVPAAADLDAGDEPGALGPHLVQPPVEHGLLHLELGDAVAQQPADPVGPLEHGDVVPGAGELLGGGQPGRPGTDDGDLLAGVLLRGNRLDQVALERLVDDLPLDLLDRDRRLLQVQHAGALARRRAQLPGELREVVGRVQPLDRLGPVVAAGEVVPLGDQVAQRAAVVAERDAAVHAPGGLLAYRGDREDGVLTVLPGEVDVLPVHDPHVDGTPRRQRPLVLEEPGRVSHVRPPSLPCRHPYLRPRRHAGPRARAGSRAA